MGLNKIQTSNTDWGKAAADLNSNFDSITTDLSKVKNATTRNKGFFSDDNALKAAFPTAYAGDYAYVGTANPYKTWHWKDSAWVKLNDDAGHVEVELGNYYTKSETDGKFTETDAKLSELGQEVYGSALNQGQTFFQMNQGELYCFVNKGTTTVNLSYKIDDGAESMRIVTDLAIGGVFFYEAKENSSIIYMSMIDGALVYASAVTQLFGKVELIADKFNKQFNYTTLKGGNNAYSIRTTEKYFLINKGSVAVKVLSKTTVNQETGTLIKDILKVGETYIYTPTESSEIVSISNIEGARVDIYAYSTIMEEVMNVNSELTSLKNDADGVSVFSGKTIRYQMVEGQTYILKNVGTEYCNIYYKVSELDSSILIGAVDAGDFIEYKAKTTSEYINISAVVGAEYKIYKADNVGGKLVKVEPFTSIYPTLEGKNLSGGVSNYSMTNGKNYVFINNGTVAVNVSYRKTSTSESIKITNIGVGSSYRYTAVDDSESISISNIDGASIFVAEEGIKTDIEIIKSDINNMPVLLKVCSFNLGDFTGDGFETPSTEGALAYKKLLGKIGASLMGTQEDVKHYGTTTGGAVGNLSVKDTIFPMYKNYIRTGTDTYNFKGFASDYLVSNVEKVVYTGDYYYSHPWFLRGELHINGKNILVLSFHLEWRDTETRNAQIDQIIAYAQNYEYVIAVGDTNSIDAIDGVYIEPKTYLYDVEWKKFTEMGYDMANYGNFGLFATTYGGSPIDNIFVKGGKIKNAYIIQEDWMRDHYPIIADIVL